MSYREVDLYYEPDKTCAYITDGENRNYSEMTIDQHAFLYGLLKEKYPKNILEPGVAAGGTTAVVLTGLKMFDVNAKVYSVDVSEKWYRAKYLDTGFIAKKFMDCIIGKTQHEFLLGKEIPYVIDEIGEGIDFLILDTTHVMRGNFWIFWFAFFI